MQSSVYYSCKGILLAFIFSFISISSFAQGLDNTVEANAEIQRVPSIDPFGRNSPRGTVKAFISAIGEKDYDKASQYLNLSQISDSLSGEEMAKKLQNILDKGGLLSLSRISTDSLGRKNDELAFNIDRVGYVETQTDSFDIYVELTESAEGVWVWLFSQETMQKISGMNLDGELLLIERLLPESLQSKTWIGVPVGQWLAVLLLILLAYIISWAISSFLEYIVKSIWEKSKREPTAGILLAMMLPLRLYLGVLLFIYIFQYLELSIILREKFSLITLSIGVTAIFLLFWRLTDYIGDYSNKRLKEMGNASGMSVVLFLQRLFKILIVIIAFIVILNALGVNVTAGIAALGIGGIALALGAQKTMENFVGSVALIADQPIRVGDFCKVGDISGTVESIGMRSTRIRKDTRTLVTIPNGEFSSSKIENFAPRDMFLFDPKIDLRYETTPDQIRYLLVELRSMLYSHPKLTIDPARVRFTEMAESSLKLEFYTYINATSFNDYLEVKEDLLLRIMDIVKESGTDFAFPSQTLYVARDEGLSKEKSQVAEEKVKKWREEEDLQVPHYDAHRIQSIKNSIQYPPEGSFDRESGKEKAT